MFDVVCIGDISQDVFLFIKDADIHAELHGSGPEICLPYGQKLNVENVFEEIGGNAANVSIGLSRLGLKISLLSIVGNDKRGDWVLDRLKFLAKSFNHQNLAVDKVFTVPSHETNLSIILNFKKERTILTFHGKGNLPQDKTEESEWLYLTSPAGRDSSEVFHQILQQKESVKLAFNPNLNDIKKGFDYIRPIVEKSRFFIVNREEAEAILNETISRQEIENRLIEISRSLPDFESRAVIITDGRNGAWGYDGNGVYYQKAAESEVKETTGAGDAFTSGALAAIIKGKNLPEAMIWGVRNAESVIQKVGAIEGLLTVSEISH